MCSCVIRYVLWSETISKIKNALSLVPSIQYNEISAVESEARDWKKKKIDGNYQQEESSF